MGPDTTLQVLRVPEMSQAEGTEMTPKVCRSLSSSRQGAEGFRTTPQVLLFPDKSQAMGPKTKPQVLQVPEQAAGYQKHQTGTAGP